MTQAGDKVMYVPGTDHAYDHNRDGSFVFSFSTRDPRTKQDRILTDAEVELALRRRHKGIKGPQINPVAPKCSWEAKVLEVYEDDTADLEVTSPLPGVRLGLARVKMTPEGESPYDHPHSWYPAP